MVNKGGGADVKPMQAEQRPGTRLKLAAEPGAGLNRLQKLTGSISQWPWLKELLTLVFGYTLTNTVIDLVEASNWKGLVWGTASLFFVTLIFRLESEFDSLLIVGVFAPFILAALDNLDNPDHLAVLLFCIGIPGVVMGSNWSLLSSLRPFRFYSLGAFLGTMAGYLFVHIMTGYLFVQSDAAKIGPAVDPGWPGYLIAATVGVLLALEMPLTYRRHDAKRHLAGPITDRRGSSGVPSMVPLTSPIGLIMGIITIFIISC